MIRSFGFFQKKVDIQHHLFFKWSWTTFLRFFFCESHFCYRQDVRGSTRWFWTTSVSSSTPNFPHKASAAKVNSRRIIQNSTCHLKWMSGDTVGDKKMLNSCLAGSISNIVKMPLTQCHLSHRRTDSILFCRPSPHSCCAPSWHQFQRTKPVLNFWPRVTLERDSG